MEKRIFGARRIVVALALAITWLLSAFIPPIWAAESAPPISGLSTNGLTTNAPAASLVAPVPPAPTLTLSNVATAIADAEARRSEDALRSYLRLQEQLHAATLEIRQARAESSVEAQSNLQAVVARMESLEKELVTQRAEQARVSGDSNRLMIFASAGILLTGVLAMVFTTIFQARGMNRLAEIATGLPSRGLPGIESGAEAYPLALAQGERLLLETAARDTGGNPGGRLQPMLKRMEERIRSVEQAAQGVRNDSVTSDVGLDLRDQSKSGVLGKAQSLLKLGRATEALAALDDVGDKALNGADHWLLRGVILERLNRFEEAITAYDQAIQADENCAQAYLSKGGLYNQQDRFTEALACFEQALACRKRS